VSALPGAAPVGFAALGRYRSAQRVEHGGPYRGRVTGEGCGEPARPVGQGDERGLAAPGLVAVGGEHAVRVEAGRHPAGQHGQVFRVEALGVFEQGRFYLSY
jgi:hypothetical protein